MKNKDTIDEKKNNEDWATPWDSLIDVPSASDVEAKGERKPTNANEADVLRRAIREKLAEIKASCEGQHMALRTFMLLLFGDLEPILSGPWENVGSIRDDFDYCRDVLREVEPIIAGYWAECDPMIIGYLFLIFVAQFMVILDLWQKVGCDKLFIRDCALMGEFYLDMSSFQSDMLMRTVEKWHLQDEGRIDPVSLE